MLFQSNRSRGLKANERHQPLSLTRPVVARLALDHADQRYSQVSDVGWSPEIRMSRNSLSLAP